MAALAPALVVALPASLAAGADTTTCRRLDGEGSRARHRVWAGNRERANQLATGVAVQHRRGLGRDSFEGHGLVAVLVLEERAPEAAGSHLLLLWLPSDLLLFLFLLLLLLLFDDLRWMRLGRHHLAPA